MATPSEPQAQAPAPASAPAPAPAPATEPKVELTINAKPTQAKNDATSTASPEAGVPPPRRPTRMDSSNMIDWSDDDDYIPRSRPRRRVPLRRFSPSPVRIRNSREEESIVIPSSTKLLAQVGSYDGVADLPYPCRTGVYLTTFPFTDRDVKKWTWLFANGFEDAFMTSPTGGAGAVSEDGYGFPVIVQSHQRSRSPYFDRNMNDLVPSIFLSRALDANVIPEAGEKTAGLRFWIVVQNKFKAQGTKLLVAESRKAAGILIYYEALLGNSIAFVGAVVDKGRCAGRARGMGMPMKAKRVETLEEAWESKDEGVIGVIC